MKRILSLFLSWNFCLSMIGQNLVQNPNMDSLKSSFSSGLGSDDFLFWDRHYAIDGSVNWSVATIHYNKAPTGAYPGKYFNGEYFPKPFYGSGYSGFTLYIDSNWSNIPANTSYLGLHRNLLKQKLSADTNYCFEMHVRFWTVSFSNYSSCYTHNNLGVHFSIADSLPSAYPWLDGIFPQVGNFGYIFNDTSWQQVSGSFIADGGELYMYIGNFNPYNSPALLHPNAKANDLIGEILYDAVYVYNCRDTLFKVVQKDTTVCWGQPVQLQPNLQGFKLQDSVRSYYWQTPGGNFTTTDSTFTATAQGNYTVTVTLNKRFTATTNFTITWVPEAPDTALLPDSLVLCPGEPRLLEAPEIPGARYRWSNGDTTRYSTIGLPGLYTLQVITPCWLHTENVLAYQSPCGTRIFIPNAFTPDGDGTNDYFEIFGPIEPFTLIVTDRWGKVVYQSEDYKNDWDGTYQGEPLPAGVYNFRIVYAKYVGGPKNYDQVGTVTLIR